MLLYFTGLTCWRVSWRLVLLTLSASAASAGKCLVGTTETFIDSHKVSSGIAFRWASGANWFLKFFYFYKDHIVSIRHVNINTLFGMNRMCSKHIQMQIRIEETLFWVWDPSFLLSCRRAVRYEHEHVELMHYDMWHAFLPP